jgi:hypothetical protein
MINSATLGLYATAAPGTGQQLDVHRITGAWDESTATWNLQPAFDTTASASIAGGTTPGWKSWTVTSLVQAWFAGTNANYGVLVKCNLETLTTAQIYDFASKEYTTDTSRRPRLVINYTSPSTGNVVDNVQVELIDPDATATVLKAFGAADASPYDVLGAYTGPGTYQVRLTEDAGGTASMTSASLHVVGTLCSPAPADNVQFLTARAGNGQVKLEWLNPAANFGSTRICWSTAAYPTDPAACSTVPVTLMGGAGEYGYATHATANGVPVYTPRSWTTARGRSRRASGSRRRRSTRRARRSGRTRPGRRRWRHPASSGAGRTTPCPTTAGCTR